MSTVPDFDDVPDSQRLGATAKAARDVPSDPGGTLRQLIVTLESHVIEDSRRWRAAAIIASLLLGLGSWCGIEAWNAHAAAAEQAAHTEDASARLGRIEQQLDRLLERRDP